MAESLGFLPARESGDISPINTVAFALPMVSIVPREPLPRPNPQCGECLFYASDFNHTSNVKVSSSDYRNEKQDERFESPLSPSVEDRESDI